MNTLTITLLEGIATGAALVAAKLNWLSRYLNRTARNVRLVQRDEMPPVERAFLELVDVLQ